MTLEKGKSYGIATTQQNLTDKSRTRLNLPTPHQVHNPIVVHTVVRLTKACMPL